jgi:serine phosphatase RsbU (regulator of sigma subunit)
MPVIDGYDFYAVTEAVQSYCGEFYDFLRLANGQLAIVLVDVAGIIGNRVVKVLTRIKAESQACFAGEVTATFAVAQLNQRLCDIGEDAFVTLIAVVLDPQTHAVTVVNAGHFPPILRRAKGNIEDPGKDKMGLPLGILQGQEYQHWSFHLQPGDSLMLFTDGFVDAENTKHEPYGVERMEQQFAVSHGSPKQIVDLLLEQVRDHLTGATQYDDITLVCIQRT